MRPSATDVLGLAPDAPHREEAITHPSAANESPGAVDNQRLEFLGDAILGFCTSEILFSRFPEADEGELTRLRAALVNAEALALWARRHDVADIVRLGRGADGSNLRRSKNVLADAVEALVAAVYLDHGLDAARRACATVVEGSLVTLAQGAARDPKSELQERVQRRGAAAPTYEVLDSGGPAHERWFEVGVRVDGSVLGRGCGRSKRLAERAAAHEALKLEGRQGDPLTTAGPVPDEDEEDTHDP
jgi:ribonuclease-3